MNEKRKFNDLSFEDRAHYINTDGTYVTFRVYYAQKIVLYSIGKIFVEAWYQPDENKIFKIEEIDLCQIENLYCGSYLVE